MKERMFLRLAGDATCGPETTVPADTLRVFPVAAPLSGHVSQILSYRETLPAGQTVAERVLPDGAVRLMFDFANSPSAGPSVRVAGASASPVVLQLGGRMESLSVALHPGAAAAVLGLPAGEIEGQALPLQALWGAQASPLIAQMAEAMGDAARVALLTTALERRLTKGTSIHQQRAHHVARLVSSTQGRMALLQAAAAVNVSERRLQQLFFEHVGLSFRAWARLSRLHACLRLIRQQAQPAWAEVAVDAGFYDQAHLANEFRALCGLSPTVFLQRGLAQSSKTGD
jgi:methylphosphotriester-DNA--protein-cysteine methyltransferase